MTKYDKESERYMVFRFDTEGTVRSLHYYQIPVRKLAPYMYMGITSKTDLTIRDTPCVLFVEEETGDSYDNKEKKKIGTTCSKTSIYINKTSGDIDSLISHKSYSDGWEFSVKEYVTDVTNFDFNALSSQLDFDNPKYDGYSRHDGDNPPFSTGGSTDNKEITPAVLDYPITDLEGRVTRLSELEGWVLLDFWQFGCRPCFAQFKRFAHERDSIGSIILEKESVQVLCIHPYSDNMEMIGQIGEKYRVSDYLYSAKGMNGQLEMYGYPTYYLVSPDKKVALKGNHPGDYSEIINVIKDYKPSKP